MQPIGLPFSRTQVPPRQLASRPGSILDCRGGNKSAASSSVEVPGRCVAVPNGQGGEQAGGPQHKGMSAVPKSPAHEKPFVGGSRTKAEPRVTGRRPLLSGEELVKRTRRTAGIRGAALQHREAEQNRDGPVDQPWVAQAARAAPIRAQPEMGTRGNGIRAWAHKSGEGG